MLTTTHLTTFFKGSLVVICTKCKAFALRILFGNKKTKSRMHSSLSAFFKFMPVFCAQVLHSINYCNLFFCYFCVLSVVRTWTLMVVTTVRYELVQSSQAKDKITELSRIVQEVSIKLCCLWCMLYVGGCVSKCITWLMQYYLQL